MGRYLNLAERAMKERVNRSAPPTKVSTLQRRISVAIPTDAVLLAPRYDGVGKPLAAVPRCWCCQTPWRLDQLEEHRGKTYAWLKPGCSCLDTWTCYSCFLCREHCHCKQNTEPSQNPSATILDRHANAEMACWHCGAKAGETGRCDCSTCATPDSGMGWKAGPCCACLSLRQGRQQDVPVGAARKETRIAPRPDPTKLIERGLSTEECTKKICELAEREMDAVCSVGEDGLWEVWGWSQ
jgi:hypothetical protein